MTLLSIVISLFIGGAEALAVIGMRAGFALSFSTFGYGIVGLFAANLAVSAFMCRLRG